VFNGPPDSAFGEAMLERRLNKQNVIVHTFIIPRLRCFVNTTYAAIK
jgi:hypothetical protein